MMLFLEMNICTERCKTLKTAIRPQPRHLREGKSSSGHDSPETHLQRSSGGLLDVSLLRLIRIARLGSTFAVPVVAVRLAALRFRRRRARVRGSVRVVGGGGVSGVSSRGRALAVPEEWLVSDSDTRGDWCSLEKGSRRTSGRHGARSPPIPWATDRGLRTHPHRRWMRRRNPL